MKTTRGFAATLTILALFGLAIGVIGCKKKKDSNNQTSSGGGAPSQSPPIDYSQLPPHWNINVQGMFITLEIAKQTIVKCYQSCASAVLTDPTANISIANDGTFNGSLPGLKLHGQFKTLTTLSGTLEATNVCLNASPNYTGTPYGINSIHVAGGGIGTITSPDIDNIYTIGCTSAKHDCSVDADYGKTITFHPTPDISSKFTGWSGACSGTGDCVLQINGDKAITASFENVGTQQLVGTVSPILAGNITLSPSGSSCQGACGTYTKGTIVTVSESPAAGYSFVSWSGACQGTAACVVTLDTDKAVTANFQTNNVNLTKGITPFGSGTTSSSPTGPSCGPGCQSYPRNTVVTVTPTPVDSFHIFKDWLGACSGSGPCQVTMVSDLTVTAEFEDVVLTVNTTGTGAGTVTSTPAGISCGAKCSSEFSPNTVVTLNATPQDQYSQFGGWSGGCNGSGSCQVTMAGSQSVTAQFNDISTHLTVAQNQLGTVTSTPSGINCGFGLATDCTEKFVGAPTVTLTETTVFSVFTGWTGDCSGTGSCVLTMNQNHAVTPTYIALITLFVDQNPRNGGQVVSSPAGIDTHSSGFDTHQFLEGTAVTLTSTPNSGWTFQSWTDAFGSPYPGCESTGPCVITIKAGGSISVNANYVQ